MLRDPYSAEPYVLFYNTKRVGSGVQDFDAIKLAKFAAGRRSGWSGWTIADSISLYGE
ncbi:phage major capsid protein [Rhodopseudomonas palustris]|nr:phage major capsid protein [Rhodopseudomonas palustris]